MDTLLGIVTEIPTHAKDDSIWILSERTNISLCIQEIFYHKSKMTLLHWSYLYTRSFKHQCKDKHLQLIVDHISEMEQ